MPGMSVTMAVSSPVRRFSRLDLPEFGAPHQRYVHPLIHEHALLSALQQGSNRCHKPIDPLRHLAAREEFHLLVGKVDRGLDKDPQPGDALVQGMHFRGESAFQGSKGAPGGGGGRAGDQVGHRFRLGQVELAVDVGPLGELARPGQAGAFGEYCFQNQLQHHRAAVALQFHHIFARKGARARKVECDPPVQGLAPALEVPQSRAAPRQFGAGDRGADGRGERAGYPHDPDPALARWRGYRRYGVVGPCRC